MTSNVRTLDVSLTAPQAEFLSMDCRYPLFTGGVGSGKSYAMIVSAFIDATHSPNATIAIYEPTFTHVRTIAVPKMMEFLTNQGIDFTYNKNEHQMELDCKQIGNFLFMSYDNPEMIVGFEAYRSHIDELDVVNEAQAQMAWNKIIARNRQNPKGLPESLMELNKSTGKYEAKNKVSVYSTPEGFKFTHKVWGTNKRSDGTWKNPEYKYTKVSSMSNPTLSEAYIQSLKDTYPGPLIEAYLNGDWVNMAAGTVYNCYNRIQHASTEKIRDGEQLYIGCDFNVTNQAATIWVKRNGGLEWHAVTELTGMYDTPEMIQTIKNRFAGHIINMYPDASGSARHTTNASVSDIALLKGAGFTVWARSKNPQVRDRVQATNNAFTQNRLKVNADLCPTVAKCFEQQAYDTNGNPDKKSGFDHQNDASTYPIAYEMMISRPLYSVPIRWVS
jgi:PBSX family phage terminase large subunit